MQFGLMNTGFAALRVLPMTCLAFLLSGAPPSWATSGRIISPCSPHVEWQASYGGTRTEYLNSVRQLPDGGYVLAGYSISGADGNKTIPHLGASWDFDWWVV